MCAQCLFLRIPFESRICSYYYIIMYVCISPGLALFPFFLYSDILRKSHTVGLCLCTSLVYDVYDCIESTEMVEKNYLLI